MTRRDLLSQQDILVENNFDFLRFLLALSVFCTHYDRIFGEYFINFPITISRSVSSFFVISGMLIFRSCLRSSSLRSFWEKRFRRILPAYVLIVLLVVVLFFPFSSLGVRDYLFSSDMVKYLFANLTTLNFLHPGLPGVMDGAAVNPSLWTIKIELLLYLSTPLWVMLYERFDRSLSLFVVAIFSIVSVLLRWHADVTGVAVYDLVGKWGSLSACYLAGISLYLYRDLLQRYKWHLFVPCLLLLLVADAPYVVEAVLPFALGVVLFVVAFSFPFLNGFGRIGDLSYGIYVYHGPIIFFTICLGWKLSLLGFAATLTITLLVAFLSWHLLEKRVLKRS